MDHTAHIARARTVGDVFGRFGLPVGFESYGKVTLDKLSHDEYGFLIEAAMDLRGEVEKIEDELTQAWARCYEMLPDGGVSRRSA